MSDELVYPEVDRGKKLHKLGTLSCVSLITNKMIGTGLFSTPSIIFKYCGGNVTLFLSLWLIGAFIIFSGLLVYLEFALNSPLKNGGEKNYLLRVFNKPKGLSGCIYAFQMVILGFSSGNSFAFGKYIWFALSGELIGEDHWTSKFIGVLCLTFCIAFHIWHPAKAASFFNILGVFKIIILFLIIFIGFLAALNIIDIQSSAANNTQVLGPTQASGSIYSVSVALLQIIYSFKGWENANYVLSEIENPYHVLTIAAPLAVLLVTVLTFLVVISYLIVIPKDEILSSGVLVAGIFFNKVFGESITSKILPLLIALLTLGNVMVVTYAHSIVNQELARNNYLPFSKVFQNINSSLILHWFISVIILLGPPSSEIYEFVVNLYVYPGTWINVFITSGLIYLKLNAEKEGWGLQQLENMEPVDTPSFPQRLSNDNDDGYTEFNPLMSRANNSLVKKFSVPWICVGLFLAANLFLALFPFIPPPSKSAPGAIPYWLFPVVGTGSLVIGGLFYFSRQAYYQRVYKRKPLYEEDYGFRHGNS